eukprot:367904-Karenia_brevis.AAC.1
MSLGDMLLLAGYEVTRDVEEEEPPPAPPGPIPPDYMASLSGQLRTHGLGMSSGPESLALRA